MFTNIIGYRGPMGNGRILLLLLLLYVIPCLVRGSRSFCIRILVFLAWTATPRFTETRDKK